MFNTKDYSAKPVIIDTSSGIELKETLRSLKNSVWWNHEALYVLISNGEENNYLKAFTFLSTVWSFNILSALYLCYNNDQQLLVYTFNPYEYLAPIFWEPSINHSSGNTWTLFEHKMETLDCKYYFEIIKNLLRNALKAKYLINTFICIF